MFANSSGLLHEPATKTAVDTLSRCSLENAKRSPNWAGSKTTTGPPDRKKFTSVVKRKKVAFGGAAKRTVRSQKTITRGGEKNGLATAEKSPLASFYRRFAAGSIQVLDSGLVDAITRLEPGRDRHSGDEIKLCGRMKFAKYGFGKTDRRPAQSAPVLFPVKAHRHACSW